VSLSWRSVAKETTMLREEYPQMAPRIEPVLDRWAEFLLERAKDPGPCDHHVIFWDPQTMRISGDEGKLPDKFFWYVMRHIDSTTVFSEKTNVIYAYSKLPHMFFWSGIDPVRPEGLRGTLIKKKGKIGLNQIIKSQDFTHFIAGRVREVRGYMAGMSDKQKEKIAKMTLADLDKTINSKSFQAFLAEQAYRQSQR
jgi:hypothetical protein